MYILTFHKSQFYRFQFFNSNVRVIKMLPTWKQKKIHSTHISRTQFNPFFLSC